MPTFHSLPGCDSTSSLSEIGKRSAWEFLQNNSRHQETLGRFRQTTAVDKKTVDETEAFICSLYPNRKKTVFKADELRYAMFCQQKHNRQSLPPTSDSLLLHIKRFNYQIYVWRKALITCQDLTSPAGHGWKITDED